MLVLDSFTTRKVKKSYGLPDLHWGHLRSDYTFCAFNFRIEQKLAKPDDVFIMGLSGSGTATFFAVKVTNEKLSKKKRLQPPARLDITR